MVHAAYATRQRNMRCTTCVKERGMCYYTRAHARHALQQSRQLSKLASHQPLSLSADPANELCRSCNPQLWREQPET